VENCGKLRKTASAAYTFQPTNKMRLTRKPKFGFSVKIANYVIKMFPFSVYAPVNLTKRALGQKINIVNVSFKQMYLLDTI